MVSRLGRFLIAFLISAASLSATPRTARAERIENDGKTAVYEEWERTPDFNEDRKADFRDFTLFAKAYGTPGGKYDLTGDGFVNFLDFLKFAQRYGMQIEVDYFDSPYFQGTLKDGETNIGVPGVVNIYNASDSSRIGSVEVGEDGKFARRVYYRGRDIGKNILFKTQMVENGAERSYWGTFEHPSGKRNGLEFKVVPYTGLLENGISKESLYRHGAELLSPETKNRMPSEDPLKWNPIISRWVDSFNRVVISKTNFNEDVPGKFSDAEMDAIKREFLFNWRLGALPPFSDLEQNDVTLVENYPLSELGKSRGVLAVYPNSSLLGRGFIGWTRYTKTPDSSDGCVAYSQTEIMVSSIGKITNEFVLTHEILHTHGFPGHAWTLGSKVTSMTKNVPPGTEGYRFADAKLVKALYMRPSIHESGTSFKGERENIYSDYTVTLRDLLGVREWN